MARISFLVPTFNRAHLLAESLLPILAQMTDEDELLVIDDGSADDTAAVVAALGPRLKYIRQDNAGKAVALNRGLATAKGAFIWICDDDDVLRNGAVSRLFGAARSSGAGFVFGRHTRFRDTGGTRKDIGTGYWPDLSHGSLARHVLEDFFIHQNAMLARREAYDLVGPFSKVMLRSVDYEMLVRLALAVPGHYVDAIVFDQRKHEGARGPAAARHSESASAAVWRRYDELIFENVRSHVPIAFYEGLFAGDPVLCARAAFLQRACVEARHWRWEAAFADLESARAVSGAPLDPGEVMICARMLNGSHGIGGALAPEVTARLATMNRSGGAARAILSAMLGGTAWRLRRGDERRDARALFRNVLGSAAAFGFAMRHAVSRDRLIEGKVRELDVPSHLLPHPIPPVR